MKQIRKEDLVFGRYKDIIYKNIKAHTEQRGVEVIYTQPGNYLGRGKLMLKNSEGIKVLDINLLGKEYQLLAPTGASFKKM